jgi:hypothetical protein
MIQQISADNNTTVVEYKLVKEKAKSWNKIGWRIKAQIKRVRFDELATSGFVIKKKIWQFERKIIVVCVAKGVQVERPHSCIEK